MKNSNQTPMVFKFDTNNAMRSLLIDNQPWFVANDICTVLELNDTRRAIQNLDEDEKLTGKIFQSGQRRKMWLVNESGLYALIMRSNKPEAKKFRKWVTNEVLPMIRQTGGYSANHFHGLQPWEIAGQIFYNYKDALQVLGLSLNSGSFHRRIRTYPNHFVLTEEGGEWLITSDYIKAIEQESKRLPRLRGIRKKETVVKYAHPNLRPHMQLSLFDEARHAGQLKEMKGGLYEA